MAGPAEPSNLRPIAIFTSYLLLCITLTAFIVRNIFRSHVSSSSQNATSSSRSKYIRRFTVLAILSLMTTWYHMFRFFEASYDTWLFWQPHNYARAGFTYNDEVGLKLGPWLRDTQLFKQAWSIAIDGHHRYWWTSQIFFFAATLGLELETKGTRRLRYTWVFMLLGQIVAISFASNLFFLSLLVSPASEATDSEKDAAESRPPQGKRLFGPKALIGLTTFGACAPAAIMRDQDLPASWFAPCLFIPHIALMVPPFIHALMPNYPVAVSDDLRWVWSVLLGGEVYTLLGITKNALREVGWPGIANAIWEHPAVSSVGFDVIFCWISWGAWWWIRRPTKVEKQERHAALEKRQEEFNQKLEEKQTKKIS